MVKAAGPIGSRPRAHSGEPSGVEPPPVSAAAPELEVATYTYNDFQKQPTPPHQPLYLSTVLRYLQSDPQLLSVLDAGCGDGNFTASVAAAGYTSYGLDMSESGIEIASRRGVGYFARGSIYEDLAAAFPGVRSFDAIIAIEVIEHLYSPREFVRRAFEALRPGGVFIVTTPYWGYLKNIALALTGRMDGALTALWDGGHIKHWSRRTLTSLLSEQSFDVIGFAGAGHRPPYLWNGMVIACKKPSNLPSPALRSGPPSPGDHG